MIPKKRANFKSLLRGRDLSLPSSGGQAGTVTLNKKSAVRRALYGIQEVYQHLAILSEIKTYELTSFSLYPILIIKLSRNVARKLSTGVDSSQGRFSRA